RALDIEVAPVLSTDGEALGASVSFSDVTTLARLSEDYERSKRELDNAYEELQSTVEELETTNEELQSTNEELETTNEELQSTNEELETMNEELQSTNEELSTINDELQMRTDELNATNAFLESILRSLGSAVIVLDRKFEVERWNQQARELWGLIEDEVRGTHFLNLDIGLPVDELRGPILDVGHNREVKMSITLMPRDRGNVAAEVVASHNDGRIRWTVTTPDGVSSAKASTDRWADRLLTRLPQGILVIDHHLRVVFANPA